MKYLLIPCLLFIVGCPATIPIIGMLGTIGMATNKFINYKLTKRGLDLKKREIELKEKIFEESKVNN
ncbi:hypothetical protein LCGC14_3008970 [marine sediment metagenome]|uniref:Uncharacterized protein n=1 Tax=marine sediment metagenome TaxID=412755 RepID=A0A0F8WYP6_9ZZZZ